MDEDERPASPIIKAGLISLWRSVALVLLRSARRPPAVPFVKPPRRWSGGCGASGEAFSNKRILLWCGEIVLLVFSPLTGHGGS
jgi:hypothetical protein